MPMPRVHATAIVQGQPRETLARCGWVSVPTSTDRAEVTCKACLRLLEAAAKRPPQTEIETIRAALLAAGGVPKAPPPPRWDPATWHSLCRPDPEVMNRCGACALCDYERELARFSALDPWRVEHRPERDADAPVFGSLNGALVALAEWRIHDQHLASQLGHILDRLRAGRPGGGGGAPWRGTSLTDRAEDVAHVDKALRLAYRDGENAAHLEPAQAEALLLLRTPGATRGALPTYQQLAEALLEWNHVTTPRELKRTVRHGRRAVSVELAARGLIRDPAPAAGLAEAIDERRRQLGGERGKD